MSIFISYSRKDSDFVRRVHEGLIAEGRETWVDWEGIPPSADWMRQIESAIDAADAVVCVLSPDFIASAVCGREVAHAARQHKRLIPIVARDVDAATVAPELARLNWVSFSVTNEFDRAIETLLTAIDTDLAWVQAHTRLLVRAVEWDGDAREASLALRGADLQAAEQWLTLGAAKTPPPTELQTRYIIESRRQATRRRSQLIGAGAFALIVLAIVGTLALTQRREASRQEAMATARRLASASERLREQQPTDPSTAGPLARSTQLAAEALLQLTSIGQRSLDADLAMRRALALMPTHVARLDASIEPSYAFQEIGFDGAGRLAAADAMLTTTGVWDLRSFAPVAGHQGGSAFAVALSADGRFVAATAPVDAGGVVEVRDVAGGSLLARLSGLGAIAEVALGPGARLVAIDSESTSAGRVEGIVTTRVWTLPDARPLATLPTVAFYLSFSPDGRYLAGVVDGRPTIWSVERLMRGQTAALAVLRLSGDAAGPLLFSPDGTRLAAGIDTEGSPGRIGVWTVGDWKLEHELAREQLLAVSPGGRYIAVRGDEAGWLTRIIEVATDREVTRLNSQTNLPPVAFHPNGHDVAVVSGRHVELWRITPRGSEAARIDVDKETSSIAFSADGRALMTFVQSGGWSDPKLRSQRWNFDRDPAASAPAVDLGRTTEGVAHSADGRWLALADDREARIVDAATGSVRQRIPGPQPWGALGLSPDGRFFAGMTAVRDEKESGQALHLWQVDPPLAIGSAPLGGLPVGNAAVSADGRRVSVITAATATRTGQALTVHVFDAPGMAELPAAVGKNRSGLAADVCALSSDGRLMAVNTAGGSLTVREVATGREIGILDEADSPARCVFSADAGLLAVTGSGDSVRIWDVTTQTEVARLEGIVELRRMAFSPDARHLATLESGGRVKVWPLRYADLLADACSRLEANIGAGEWGRTMGARPYRAACPARPVPDQ